jgi:HEAT repeat protein
MGLIAWLKRKLQKRMAPSLRQDSRYSAEAVAPLTLLSDVTTSAPVQSVEVLLKMLTSSNPAERRAAASGLGRTGDVDVVFTPLVTTLRSDPEPEVRAAAAGALGGLGDPRAIPELTAALSDLGEVTATETVYNWAYEGDPPGEKMKVLYRVATAARDALSRLGVKA